MYADTLLLAERLMFFGDSESDLFQINPFFFV